MRSTSLPVAVLIAAVLCSPALVAGCGKDSSSPAANVPGPAFNFTFPQTGTSHELVVIDVGTWNYVCTTHSGMNGTISVVNGGADSVVVNVGPGNTLTFSPSPATIKPGGKVRFVNQSSMTNHTATR